MARLGNLLSNKKVGIYRYLFNKKFIPTEFYSMIRILCVIIRYLVDGKISFKN